MGAAGAAEGDEVDAVKGAGKELGGSRIDVVGIIKITCTNSLFV